MPDVGATIAEGISHYYDNPASLSLIENLRAAGLNFEKYTVSDDSIDKPLHGKVFVITGTFQSMKRKEIVEIIKAYGGTSSDSVTSKTSYLIAGEKAGSKLTKANEAGVPIISEEEFIKLRNDGFTAM